MLSRAESKEVAFLDGAIAEARALLKTLKRRRRIVLTRRFTRTKNWKPK